MRNHGSKKPYIFADYNTVIIVRGTIHFTTRVFQLSSDIIPLYVILNSKTLVVKNPYIFAEPYILSRFCTVFPLITMAFSLSTYCAQIFLFHIFVIWLKRAPERGWKKKNVKKTMRNQ